MLRAGELVAAPLRELERVELRRESLACAREAVAQELVSALDCGATQEHTAYGRFDLVLLPQELAQIRRKLHSFFDERLELA